MYRHFPRNQEPKIRISPAQKIFSETPLALYRLLQYLSWIPIAAFGTFTLRDYLAGTFVRSEYSLFLPMAISLAVFNFASLGARKHSKLIAEFFQQDADE